MIIFRYAYGVIRFGAVTDPGEGLVEVAILDGIFAYQYSLPIDSTSSPFGVSAVGDMQPGPNPLFKMRDYGYIKEIPPVPWTEVIDNGKEKEYTRVYFVGDGRETSQVGTSDTDLTSTTVQTTPFTRCLVCHGSEEFSRPPSRSKEVTIPCWNPSDSSFFGTDRDDSLDPKKFCTPPYGYCNTITWQYSTKASSGSTSSYWVGIQRGCMDLNDNNLGVSGENGFAHTTDRGATGKLPVFIFLSPYSFDFRHATKCPVLCCVKHGIKS